MKNKKLSNLSMFMVMLGFTFFSASMWAGQKLAAGLDFRGFLLALLLGGLILAAYTGALGYIGGESGFSLDELARRSFGEKGSYLPSAMISFTQIGWFGVGLAMFAIPVAKELLGLEVTPDHMPWQGYLLVLIAGILMTGSAYFDIKGLTVIAFFLGNSLMFFFGAVSSIYAGGNDIFEVMLNLNMFYIAVLVLGLNIWTTNDNALFTSGLGLSNIFGLPKKTMVLIAGLIGTLAAVWLYWNFCDWLNILNATLPPVGIILIISYFTHRKEYLADAVPHKSVDWWAVFGVIAGAVVANLVKWGFPAINGMAVAAVCYLIGQWVAAGKEVK